MNRGGFVSASAVESRAWLARPMTLATNAVPASGRQAVCYDGPPVACEGFERVNEMELDLSVFCRHFPDIDRLSS